jgi:hypothetical protein
MASHRWAIGRQTSRYRSDLQTFADERFASKMPVERMERNAKRFGRELVLCVVSRKQICTNR